MVPAVPHRFDGHRVAQLRAAASAGLDAVARRYSVTGIP